MFGEIAGVVVVKVSANTPALKAGLREGDVILSVNRVKIDDVNSFVELVGQSRGQLLLGVLRGRQSAYLLIK